MAAVADSDQDPPPVILLTFWTDWGCGFAELSSMRR